MALFRLFTTNKNLEVCYKTAPQLKKWIIQNQGTKADAEDIVQDSVIATMQYIEKNKLEINNIGALFFTIGKRLWLQHLRKQAISINYTNIELFEIKSLHFEYDDAPIELNYKKLLPALDAIGNKCLELLRCVFYEKKSMDEIANLLQFRNAKVAKAMKYKCLEKVRNIVVKKENITL